MQHPLKLIVTAAGLLEEIALIRPTSTAELPQGSGLFCQKSHFLLAFLQVALGAGGPPPGPPRASVPTTSGAQLSVCNGVCGKNGLMFITN